MRSSVFSVNQALEELRKRFAPTDAQVACVEPILKFYESRGLLRGNTALPLYESCVCAAECWRDATPDDLPDADLAGISLPWVGERYADQRVAIVALNFHDYGGLWANWDIKPHELTGLIRGSKRINNSAFAYATGSYAAAAIASLEGQTIEVTELPEPQAGAEALQGYAFLQAIKCSPPTSWRMNSEPTGAMKENCPREYLLEELALLAPKVLIVLGDLAAERLRILKRTHSWDWRGHLGRGLLELNGSTLEVLHCRHPSSYGYAWSRSYADLVGSLQSKALRVAA